MDGLTASPYRCVESGGSDESVRARFFDFFSSPFLIDAFSGDGLGGAKENSERVFGREKCMLTWSERGY
jgi:hypothetical protein